jgi:quercetin dioxygenase-like cupin family protein
MCEQYLRKGYLPRHRHRGSYAAIVLEGEYCEFGDTGRWQVEVGDIVAHTPFESHGNLIRKKGSVVINFPIPRHLVLPPVFRIRQVDDLI